MQLLRNLLLGPQELSFQHFGDIVASLWVEEVVYLSHAWKEFENVQTHFLMLQS